jgi:cyclopropane fatty-acyl-phospholipid synthase-like methyltransferase
LLIDKISRWSVNWKTIWWKIMGVNLQILGLQAIPRLAKKFDVDLEGFLTYSDLYGKNAEEFKKACNNCIKILSRLFEKCSISWWDAYLNSDIGMERTALARDMGLGKDDTVLEVGCGRGYFSVAAARLAERVIGLDIMNGGGRFGWWKNFKETIGELDLRHKVIGLKADCQTISMKDCSVNKVIAAHSIRNLENKHVIQSALREMYRVLSEDGEMIVAENISIARNKSQEAHLAFYKCKCKYISGDLFYYSQEEFQEMFKEAGFGEVDFKLVDYNLSAAPPIFYLNTSLLKKEQIEKAQEEYNKAVDLIRKHGETSPPTLIVKVTKHSK